MAAAGGGGGHGGGGGGGAGGRDCGVAAAEPEGGASSLSAWEVERQ